MLTPSLMELVGIVILKEKLDEFTPSLVKLSIFQPVDISVIEKDIYSLKKSDIEKETAYLEDLELKLNNLAKRLNIPLKLKELKSFNIETIERILDDISKEFEPLFNKYEELKNNLKTKELSFLHLKKYFPLPIKLDKNLTFLDIFFGSISQKDLNIILEKLKGINYLFYPIKSETDGLKFMLICLKKDSNFIKKILQETSYKSLEFLPQEKEVYKDLEDTINLEIKKIKEEIKDINEKIISLSRKNEEILKDIYTFIRVKKSVISAKEYFYTTDKTAIIFGWVPEEEKDKLVSILKKLGCEFYIEEKKTKELNLPKEEIPVKMKHNKFIKPFELLIENFDLPRYGTIDPTVFVAISFLFMFGAMFGDLGHGLLLILIGLFTKRSKKDKIKKISALLIYSGISSSLFGILYGSFFGLECIPSILINPMRDIFGAFKISIIFGVILISFGILLNILNALRDRDYIKAIFDKAGLVVGIIYWLILGLIVKLFIKNSKVEPIYTFLIFIFLTILFLRPLIEMFFNKERKENIFIMFMENFVEIFESFIGYFANTISFIRISAFSLAHIGLFLAIFELSKIVKDIGGGILSILVIIFGNIFIVFLEGMIVTIQTLRLNYYEFFSKFFVPAKEHYKPLSIEK